MKNCRIIFAGLLLASAAVLGHTEVTPETAYAALQADPNAVLVDVRETTNEYCSAAGHARGAYNYPWTNGSASGFFKMHYTDFPTNTKLYLICAGGSRSHSAAIFLDGKGYTSVFDIQGGTSAWINKGLPTAGCVDTDKDKFNDDLDNCPNAFNPTQYDHIWLGDLSAFSARWLKTETNALTFNDLLVFAQHWLEPCL